MNTPLVLLAVFAAVQVGAEQQVDFEKAWGTAKDTLRDLYKLTGLENVDKAKLEEMMTKGFNDVKTQMEDTMKNMREYVEKNPDSGLGQVVNNLNRAMEDFKTKHSDVAEGMESMKNATVRAAEDFAKQMEAVKEQVQKSGVGESMQNAFKEMGEKFKKASADWEENVKKLIHPQ